MEKIKKNWKVILIVFLVLFGMNKCTVSCNRGTTINKQNVELMQKDSVIKVKTDSLNIMKIRWDDAQSNKTDLVGVALNTKQELNDEIAVLKIENKNLNDKVKKIEVENINLKKENKQLKLQLNGKH